MNELTKAGSASAHDRQEQREAAHSKLIRDRMVAAGCELRYRDDDNWEAISQHAPWAQRGQQ